MESINISFSANRQTLTGGGLYCASNTVHYIIADFELGDGWDGFDSVRAVWSNDFKCISTVLDPDGSCTVPHEVLERRGKVSVNLVGSILEDDKLTDRLTTYPILAITVDANAKICGTETAEVTPSQFEQYVAIVIAEVEKVTGMTAVAHALPEGSEPTANYSGGVLTLGIPKGDTGATGNGISSVEFNEDYSLTFYFTDSEPFTTPSIRGAQGARGYGIASVEKIDSTGLVDTYRITFEDPSVQPTTFTVTNGAEGPQGPRGYTGETGNGIDRIELTDTTGAVKTYTIYFTDGSTYDFEVTDGEVTLAELASVLPTDTASGAIASFEDGSNLFDYLSCIVDIAPLQDLHGYDKPWVGGAGKNLIPYPYFNGSSATVSGVTFTVSSEGIVTINGTATENAEFTLINGVVSLPAGSYTLSGLPTGGGSSTFVFNTYARDANSGSLFDVRVGTDRTFTVASDIAYLYIGIRVISGYSATNLIAKPQFENGSSATSFAPWENLCPITGWTGCEVDVGRANGIANDYNDASNGYVTGHYLASDGTETSSAGFAITEYIPTSAGDICFIACSGISNPSICFYDENHEFVYGEKYNGRTNVTVTAPNNSAYVRLSFLIVYRWQIKVTNSVYNITWQTEAGTVYGGKLDVVSGVLTVDRAVGNLEDLDWSDSSATRYISNVISGMKPVPDGDTLPKLIAEKYRAIKWSDGLSINHDGIAVANSNYAYFYLYRDENTQTPSGKFVYELAQPQTYQLDPVQMACLLGQNNVWADCGDIEEVKYKADVQLWVEKKLGE